MMMHGGPSTNDAPGHPDSSAGRDALHFPPDYQSSFEMALTSALCFVVACGAAYLVLKTDSRVSIKVFAGVTGFCFFLAGIVEAFRTLHHAKGIISRRK